VVREGGIRCLGGHTERDSGGGRGGLQALVAGFEEL